MLAVAKMKTKVWMELWVTWVRWRWEAGGLHKWESERENDSKHRSGRVEADWLKESRRENDWTTVMMTELNMGKWCNKQTSSWILCISFRSIFISGLRLCKKNPSDFISHKHKNKLLPNPVTNLWFIPVVDLCETLCHVMKISVYFKEFQIGRTCKLWLPLVVKKTESDATLHLGQQSVQAVS